MYKVLLVDDEYMILNGLERLIDWQALGFEIVGKVKNGKAALEFVRANSVDVVLSDISMPVKSGIDFVKEAKAEHFDFEVIMLSGYQEFDYVKEVMNFGATGYLVKPISEEELTAKLKEVKAKLIEKNEAVARKRYAGKFVLTKWVKSDINLEEVMRVFDVSEELMMNNSFTVIFIKQEKRDPAVKSFFIKHHQPFVFYDEEHQTWVDIFLDYEAAKTDFFKALFDTSQFTRDDLMIGTTVKKFNEVSLSYESILSNEMIEEFYQNIQRNHPAFADEYLEDGKPSLAFIKLSKAISSSDIDEIEIEVKGVLRKITRTNVQPEYAKHLIFLLFIDLYRNFKLSETFYQKYAQKIMNSTRFEELNAAIFDALTEIRESKKAMKYSQHVEKILSIVEKEYAEDINLTEISERLFLNPVYAGQLFKKEVGMSFSQYLNQFRINKAQECLLNTSDSIGTIAIKTGYSTANYLSKNFRKAVGLSPKEFRNKYTH